MVVARVAASGSAMAPRLAAAPVVCSITPAQMEVLTARRQSAREVPQIQGLRAAS